MSEVRAVGVAAVGAAFVRSPRYLAEKIADAVDARGPNVRDERHFWRNVVRIYDLLPSELPNLQARIAAKYCRNLDLWKAIPSLHAGRRLFLLYSGPETILECWRGEYRLDSVFDGIIAAAGEGLTASDPELYLRLAEEAGVGVRHCLVIEASRAGHDAALEAGALAYRYGTAYGLCRYLDRLHES